MGNKSIKGEIVTSEKWKKTFLIFFSVLFINYGGNIVTDKL